MAAPPLACTVRGCARPLVRRERAWSCGAGHRYDIARAGYVNLLQPQDRRSHAPGDSKEAVAARHRLLARGVGRTIVQGVAGRVPGICTAAAPVVADLGCGSGELLATLARARALTGIGIDLSTAAAEHAARACPALTWVVANADRRLPLLDGSVHLVTSLNGRRNPQECARVLAPDGVLLVAVPAADDLVELREHILGARLERPRGESVIDEHDRTFALLETCTLRERYELDRAALLDLLVGTYRGGRHSAAARLETLTTLPVTLASQVFVFRRRGPLPYTRAPRPRSDAAHPNAPRAS